MNSPQKRIFFYTFLTAGIGLSQEVYAYEQTVQREPERLKPEIVKQAVIRYFNPFASLSNEKKIPKIRFIKYTIQQGDTLSEIAARHGISLKELIKYNKIKNPDLIAIGLKIKIPIEQKHSVPKTSRNQSFENQMGWPVTGTITSQYGNRWGSFHKGIDIWNKNEARSPIQASQSGKVLFAGRARGYGYLVILDHGKNIKTYYAHMRKTVVQKGETVNKGDVLGYMGSTGNSTGYHVHFEIRFNDKTVNPLSYLS